MKNDCDKCELVTMALVGLATVCVFVTYVVGCLR